MTGFLVVTVIFYLVIFAAYMADATAEFRSSKAPRWWFAASALVMLIMAAWGAGLLWKTLP